MRWKFDWTDYVDQQLRWADLLIKKANRTPGAEGDLMLARGMRSLAEANRLLDKDLETDKPLASLPN